ncbi:MAG: class II fructose-1,6-bisphosphate aldolase [Oscillibacter sp.]|nr:class II fructose-1,6-bisphosphate aldolase [Oscillibacter sp.]
MSLVKMGDLLCRAQREHYAVGAFNAENMEMVQAIIAAAEELKAPVIVQTTPSTISYASTKMYQSMVLAEAQKASVPVVMHLDHGDSYARCIDAIRAGYTSVMIDGSKLPFEENIALSKKVEEAAAAAGVDVEAELGTVGGKEDGHVVLDADAIYTKPAQAKEFAERSGVQFLVVAIGTAHGFYKGEPKLDFDRLEEIRKVVDIPLVLHGASGVPDEMVRRAIGLGICKVNFATELRAAYTAGVRTVLTAGQVYDPKKYGVAGRENVNALVKEKIAVCGCAGKA